MPDDPIPGDPNGLLPLTAEDKARWDSRLDRARRRRQHEDTGWQQNLDDYRGKPWAKAPEDDRINVPKAFAIVEQKKALLFFQTPDVQLKPSPLMDALGLTPAVTAHQTIVNEYLGADKVDALSTVDKVLFDALCPSGFGVSKIGYTVVTTDVEQPVVLPDPMTGQPMPVPDPANPMLPLMETVPVPIFEACFWERVSPKKFLIPDDFHDTDFEKAPWLGVDFALPFAQAKEKYALPDDFSQKTHRDEHIFKYGHATSESDDLVEGVELWYKASLFDPTVPHPEQMRQLVLITGLDTPVEHRDSPYQSVDAQGRLTADSLLGFPIHVLTLRDLSDSAYIPSDVAIIRPQLQELSEGRTMMVQQRKRSLPLRWFDVNQMDSAAAEKLAKGELQAMIPLNGPGGNAIGEIARANYPRENFTFNDYINRDVEEATAIGANQLGVTDETSRTATEVQTVQQASDARLDKERARVLRWYLKGVAKLDALLLRYLTPQQVIEIVGPEAGQAWTQWDKRAMPGRLAYTAKPDSAIRIDVASDRKQKLDYYNLTANDPYSNRQETLRMLAMSYGLDPARVIIEPQPGGPPPPNVSMRLGGEHLDPTMPQFPIVMEIMRQAGYQISDEAIAAAQEHARQRSLLMGSVAAHTGLGEMDPGQLAHGGAAIPMAPISKHSADETGQRSGPPVQ